MPMGCQSCPLIWHVRPTHKLMVGSAQSCPLNELVLHLTQKFGVSAKVAHWYNHSVHLAKKWGQRKVAHRLDLSSISQYYLGSAQSCPFIQPPHPKKEGGVSTKLPTDSTHLSSSQSNMGSAQSYPPSSSHLAVTILHNLLLASWEPVLDVSSDLLAGSTVSQPNF